MKLDCKTFLNEPYFCQACLFLFSVHTELPKNKVPNCPCCGDHVEVKKYHTKVAHQIKTWTKRELDLLDKLIDGKIYNYQVAAMTGRTMASIDCKMRRVKRSREKRAKS